MPINRLNHEVNTPKQDHIVTLIQEGTPLTEIAKRTGSHKKYVEKINRRLRESDLTHPKTRKLASSALSNFLKGKAFGDIDSVPASVVMQAVKEVYDRVDPKVNVSVSKGEQQITHVHIDLSQYQDAETPVGGRSRGDAGASIRDAEIIEE